LGSILNGRHGVGVIRVMVDVDYGEPVLDAAASGVAEALDVKTVKGVLVNSSVRQEMAGDESEAAEVVAKLSASEDAPGRPLLDHPFQVCDGVEPGGGVRPRIEFADSRLEGIPRPSSSGWRKGFPEERCIRIQVVDGLGDPFLIGRGKSQGSVRKIQIREEPVKMGGRAVEGWSTVGTPEGQASGCRGVRGG